jgi:hypothetical protein
VDGGGVPDPNKINFHLMIGRTDQYSAQVSASDNALLLGYTTALNKEVAHSWAYQDGLSAKAESYLSDLAQERYFVVLLAYDYREMKRTHRNADVQATLMGGSAFRSTASTATIHQTTAPPLPVWSVRMNIRAAGNNFARALPAMSGMAADYFGKQMDDLVTAQASIGSRAHVEIGETKVIGEGK